MAGRKFDIRQSRFYGILQQILPFLTFQEMDTVVLSIDSDLTVPLRVDANNPSSLIVNVKGTVITNTYSNRSRSISFINNSLPTLVSGTVTFPSASGGNITTSTGGTTVLTCPPSNYAQVLLSLDSTGDLIATAGGASPTLSSATVPSPPTNTLPFAYVTVFNAGGTIQNITQSNIYQLLGGGGSSSGGTATGFAQEVPLTIGTTNVTVTFPSSLAGTGYIVNAQMVNTIDVNPEFQAVTITNKTVNGFTASWNAALDTTNYNLDYVVPGVQSQIGEVSIGIGVTSISVTLPIAMTSTAYVVTAQMIDTVDGTPQFQPINITAKSTTGFTASWNTLTDTANYRLDYNAAVYQ
jgi:hypothetical protein